MFNWTLPPNHKAALAEQNQHLTPEKPGTIGFEIEQLYYHGQCLGPIIEVQSQKGDEAPRREPPHHFLAREKPKKDEDYLKNGAYDKALATSDLLSITLDTVLIEKRIVSTKEYEIKHVMEFVTAPMTLSDALEPALEQVANITRDLYTYCKANHAEKFVYIKDWISIHNLKTYATHHKMAPSKDFSPAEPLINLAVNDVNPLFCIHVNTSILLEQMYTPEMREAFPIFTDYPPVVNEATQAGLKDWPSTRPNAAYEAWELKLTENIHEKVNDYVHKFVKLNDNTNEYSQKRIAGYFRTIIYSFCVMAVNRCTSTSFYNKEEFETHYMKDFFLHGIAKIKLHNLLRMALTTRERTIMKNLTENPDSLIAIYEMIHNIVKEANILMDVTVPIYIDHSPNDFRWSTYIYETLIRPARDEGCKRSRLPVKPLDTTLPFIDIDGEKVVVPVMEFRACEGNGCTLAQLENLLTTQAGRAAAFAKKGFEQMPKYEPKSDASNAKPK